VLLAVSSKVKFSCSPCIAYAAAYGVRSVLSTDLAEAAAAAAPACRRLSLAADVVTPQGPLRVYCCHLEVGSWPCLPTAMLSMRQLCVYLCNCCVLLPSGGGQPACSNCACGILCMFVHGCVPLSSRLGRWPALSTLCTAVLAFTA
jgi:hypothetical protein